MAEPFLAEIRIMSFGFAPQGWAMCNGQTLPINQNQALFSLLGTTYGGNGQTNFKLPDLQGQTPIHFGQHLLGEKAGEQAHTLSTAEMPMHVHTLQGTNTVGNTLNPRTGIGGSILASDAGKCYAPTPTALTALNPASVSNTGGSQAHQSMQPFLTLTFCIALQGIFPSRN